MTQKNYTVDGISAVYYPQSGSYPDSVDLTILKDDEESDRDNKWETTAKTSVIRIFKDDLSHVVRTFGTTDPVPEKETIEFHDFMWIVKEILDSIDDEWLLMVEKDI